MQAEVAQRALDRLAELTKPNYSYIGIDLGTAQSMAGRTVKNPLSNNDNQMSGDYIRGLKFDEIPIDEESGKPIVPTVVFFDP